MANSDEVKSENALMGSGFVSLRVNADGPQTDDEGLLPSLPTVEQMQRDVANATCELQRPYFQPVDECPESCEVPAQQNSTKDSLWPDQKVPTTEEAIDGSGTAKEDPLHRTREETVSEELIINGKRYRHTYQKRTVLERQKTREVFILPASPKCPRIGGECHEEKYASSNFDNYHQAFEESGVRLELSVKNLEGSFNPMVVVVPQTDSPATPRLRSSRRSSPKQGSPVKTIPELGQENEENDSVFAPNSGPITVTSPDVEPRNNTTTPLVVSHMYHFGKWGKDAAILDPRLPAGLKLPAEVCGPKDSIFSVAPVEWHQSDITYGGGTAGSSGTKAKARIVACLQRFTQRSAQTGKQLYRGTYVQHTKIARWRTSSRPGEPPQSAESTPPSSADQSPKARNPPSRPSGNFPESVANVSEVWKQGARSPLGHEGEAFFPRDDTHRPRPLRACSYRRLQLLQSICPAAAAAVLILGKQMPEMRGTGISPPHTPSNFTVTADAWCPRALMLTEPDSNALIFSSANSADEQQANGQDGCFLRGGTLDALLVYALQIFRQKKSDTYERLIPDIFMRLYPTFTLADEVVSRLIQRFLAFAPIEPGGLGRVGEGADTDDPDVVWGEALNSLQFLVKLLSRSKRVSVNSKLGIKILRLGELLKLDARTFTNQSDVPHTPRLDAGSSSSSQEGSPTKPPHESAISKELDHISDCLLELVPKIYSDQSDLAEAVIRPLASVTLENGMKPHTCTCLQKLEKFRRFDIRELAEQITIIEEAFFDSIQLSELIKIKDLERGNTPTLSRCVQNFNDLNSMVTCLTLIAKELGQPVTRDQHEAEKAGSGGRGDLDDPKCHLCGLPREASAPQGLSTGCRSSVAGEPVVMRRNSLKVYLCMASSSAYLSMRAKRNNFLLESTLWRLCDLAEELKKMNNFSSFLAVILGLQNAPTLHVSKKLKLKLNDFGAYMLPPSFIAYRRDLENARMPCLPYLGLVFQQLIHLDSGNPLFLPSVADTEGEAVPANCSGLITEDEADADKVVNFWRCWKHYLILGYFMKRADTDMLEEGERRSYGFKPNAEIQGFLNSFNSPTMKLLPRRHDPVGGAKLMPSRSQRTKSVNFPLNS